MTTKYFRYFPTVKHSKETLLDITKRLKVFDGIINNPVAFLPYTVRNDDRPEDVSYLYYGGTEYVWLVYIANNIIDPYHDWVMNDEKLNAYIIAKYAEKSGLSDYQVIDWAMATNINANRIHYRRKTDYSDIISVDTFDLGSTLIPGFNPSEWEAVRAYDYEFEMNENKRNITLLNNNFRDTAMSELSRLLND